MLLKNSTAVMGPYSGDNYSWGGLQLPGVLGYGNGYFGAQREVLGVYYIRVLYTWHKHRHVFVCRLDCQFFSKEE